MKPNQTQWDEVRRYLASTFYPGEEILSDFSEDDPSPEEFLKRLKKLYRNRAARTRRILKKTRPALN